MKNDRLKRLTSTIHKELSLILQREYSTELGMVGINFVRVSKDLSFADIYVMFINRPNDETTLSTLQGLASKIRGRLGAQIMIKYLPLLRFHKDEVEIHAQKIDSLIESVEKAQDNENALVQH